MVMVRPASDVHDGLVQCVCVCVCVCVCAGRVALRYSEWVPSLPVDWGLGRHAHEETLGLI
jgi:hypothetical protein